MAKPAPPGGFTVPPATKASKKEQSKRGAYNAFIAKWGKQYPGMKKYASAIWQAAIDQNVDPVWFAQVIFIESKGNPGPVSDRGAVGLGQVEPNLHQPPWMNHKATAAELTNTTVNLEIAAWYYRQGYDKTGNWHDAYTKYYNNGYGPGAHGYAGPFGAQIPKGYNAVGTTGTTPGQAANNAATRAAARGNQPVLTDMAVRQHYDPIFQSYLGRGMTQQEVKRLARNPTSDFQLENQLMQSPRFTQSPLWKSRSEEYFATWQNIFGPNAKMNPTARNAIKLAIVRNWDSAAFQTFLRNQPYYNQSEEYKGLFAQYSGQYQQIYGKPTEQSNGAIQMAVKRGWNAEQWTSYLRNLPEWKSSAEYKKMAEGLVNAMGMLPQAGGQTVLQPGSSTPVALGK